MEQIEKIDFERAITEKGYLLNFCENIYKRKNYKETFRLPNELEPTRMVFETEIWMVGSEIWTKMKQSKKEKKKIDFTILLKNIFEVIHTKKYLRGRESFVLLLDQFKNNPTVNKELGELLDDDIVYGFAISSLNKIKDYEYVDKVEKILKNEKKAWIKKEMKKYIENTR